MKADGGNAPEVVVESAVAAVLKHYLLLKFFLNQIKAGNLVAGPFYKSGLKSFISSYNGFI
jgi:hypothetical protein